MYVGMYIYVAASNAVRQHSTHNKSSYFLTNVASMFLNKCSMLLYYYNISSKILLTALLTI